MTPFEKAQQGKMAIIEAMLDLLGRESPNWVWHKALVEELGLESEYKGGQRNYVTASLLDELERAGKVIKNQEYVGGPMRYRLTG
jgi:hypothetical protein